MLHALVDSAVAKLLHQAAMGCASTSVKFSTQLVASEDGWPGTDSTDLQKNWHVGEDQRSTAAVNSRFLERVRRWKAHMLLHKHLPSYQPLASQGLLEQKLLSAEYSTMFSLPSKPHTLSGPVTNCNKGFNDIIGADWGSSPSVCSEHDSCYLHMMCGDQTWLSLHSQEMGSISE